MTTQSRTNMRSLGPSVKALSTKRVGPTPILTKTRDALKVFRAFLKLENKNISRKQIEIVHPLVQQRLVLVEKNIARRDKPLQYSYSDIFLLLILLAHISRPCVHHIFFRFIS